MPEKRNYYTEEPPKDSRFHKAYLEGVNAFLEKSREAANQKRDEFIDPAAYKNDPEFYREKLCEQLGYPLSEKRVVPKLLEKNFVIRDQNVNIYRMVFEFFDSIPLYGLYFEQVEDAASAPFFIAQHGGGGTPEIISSFYSDSGNYYHMARRLTDRGANVFAPQLLLWREDQYGTPYRRSEVDGKLRQLGGSITALELYMMRGSLDYFVENGYADPERLGVVGLSYGGMYSLHLAAIDNRIKACYSCSWVSDEFEYSWADWSYQNAQLASGTVETAAMIAPRALIIAMGERDTLFSYKLTQKTCNKIAKYYREFGCEDKFLPVIFDGGHAFDKADTELDFIFDNI